MSLYSDRSNAAFARAQAAYDNATPPEYEPFRCPVSGESSEDCDREDHECEDERDDDFDAPEPDDFDEWYYERDAWEDRHYD